MGTGIGARYEVIRGYLLQPILVPGVILLELQPRLVAGMRGVEDLIAQVPPGYLPDRRVVSATSRAGVTPIVCP